MMWEHVERDNQAWCMTEGVFTPPELDHILALKDRIPPEEGRIGAQAPGKSSVGFKTLTGESVQVSSSSAERVRQSTVRWIHPAPELEWLFQRVEEVATQLNDQFFHLGLDGFKSIQLTEYRGDASGRYGAHVDVGYGLGSPSRRRKLSFAMQLSSPDDYEGGDFQLYSKSLTPETMKRGRGVITVFRSHVLHEVTPVTSGVRDSLVAWIEGPELR